MDKLTVFSMGTALGAAVAAPAQAAEIGVKLDLPEITTGMYMKPYVALFVEKDDDTFVRSLSLWHMVNPRRGPPREGGAGPQGGPPPGGVQGGPPPGEGGGAGAPAAGGAPQAGGPGGAGTRTGGPPAGDRYLNSLRDWWRTSGTTSQMPIDGVSSATRGAGTQEVVFTQGKAPLNDLPPGKYQLIVEVAREIKAPRPAGMAPGEGPPRGERGPPPEAGGAAPGARPEGGARGPSKDALEEVRIPFEWPVKKVTTVTAKGKAEVGAITLTLKP